MMIEYSTDFIQLIKSNQYNSIEYYTEEEYDNNKNLKSNKFIASITLCLNDIDSHEIVNTFDLHTCKNLNKTNELGIIHGKPKYTNYSLEICDENMLGNLYGLSLDCIFLSNTQMLKLINTVNLKDCKNINDLNGLKSIRTLTLWCCDDITDVSMLHNLETLEIIECNKIKDVGSLRKLKIIGISKCVCGLHLLNKLQKIIFNERRGNNCYKFSECILKKLKKINQNVIVRYVPYDFPF